MSGSGGIQTSVGVQPVPGIPGDFCDHNPRYSVDAGPFGLVAGLQGVTIGRFGWLDPTTIDANGTPSRVNNFGFGPPAGFIHREQQGLNTVFLADAGNVIPAGNPVTLMSGGGFWVLNADTDQAQFGQKVFAELATGRAFFAPAGTIFGGASATGSSIAAATFSVTGSINNGLMTVTAVGSGTIPVGASVSGTGIPITPAPKVVAQLTGTPGGVGTYEIDVGEFIAASTTISGTYGILTIGTATGTFIVGEILTGSGVVAGTAITQNITGAGGTGGTMVVNNNTVVASTTITASAAVETSFFARSTGLLGEAVKMSNQLVP